MALLFSILACAVYCDLKERRIPNALILIGLPGGLINSYLSHGSEAALLALAAAAVAMLTFIPPFAVRLMGAGDVKLMGVVGAFVGWQGILPVMLYTLMAGGVLGLVAVVASRTTGKFFSNLKIFFVATVMRMQTDAMPLSALASRSAVRIPYAVAIAAGVIIWMLSIS